MLLKQLQDPSLIQQQVESPWNLHHTTQKDAAVKVALQLGSPRWWYVSSAV